MVHLDRQEVEAYSEAARLLVSEDSSAIAAPSKKGEHADVEVQTYVGTHDDDKKTAVHDGQTQMEAGDSSSHVSYHLSWTQVASKEEGKNCFCEVS